MLGKCSRKTCQYFHRIFTAEVASPSLPHVMKCWHARMHVRNSVSASLGRCTTAKSTVLLPLGRALAVWPPGSRWWSRGRLKNGRRYTDNQNQPEPCGVLGSGSPPPPLRIFDGSLHTPCPHSAGTTVTCTDWVSPSPQLDPPKP